MEATEKQQSDFNNIKRRIIEPAIKELTEKDNWIIKWQPIKSGRKVTALRFDFERNPQERLF
jgi:plasmid replication initiation protein